MGLKKKKKDTSVEFIFEVEYIVSYGLTTQITLLANNVILSDSKNIILNCTIEKVKSKKLMNQLKFFWLKHFH